MISASKFIASQCSDFSPRTAIVLGSGLGFFASEAMEVLAEIPFQDIPGLPAPTAASHQGKLILGYLEGHPVICQQGRLHAYEGYRFDEITALIRIYHELGIKTVILTNAAGAINEAFEPGSLMLIKDHINFMGGNPLVQGFREREGTRFPDMTYAYDRALRELAKKMAEALAIPLHEGVYLGALGPSFETPAEIRAFRIWGADAVGMSTVPECIEARQLGIRVLGISCMTNWAAGLKPEPLDGAHVIEVANQAREPFAALLRAVVTRLGI